MSTMPEFSDTYTCQECGVVEAYEKAYEVGGIASSKLVCRSCAKKEEGRETMSTRVWCEDCERFEIVCECVDNPERDNACYELEQSENCEHPQEGKL